MRYIFFLCVILFLSSCTSEKNFKKPDWLVGKWVRTNNEANKKTYEYWNANHTGLGFTLQEQDTVFVERMSIVANKNDTYLQVVGIGEMPTLFEFTDQDENSFIVENNQNQFPKKITYFNEKDTLKAVISNDEFAVDFSFVKLKE